MTSKEIKEAPEELKATIFILGLINSIFIIALFISNWGYVEVPKSMEFMIGLGFMTFFFLLMAFFYMLTKEKSPERKLYEEKINKLKIPNSDVQRLHEGYWKAFYKLKKRERELKENGLSIK